MGIRLEDMGKQGIGASARHTARQQQDGDSMRFFDLQ
jgi:hypothetical protein